MSTTASGTVGRKRELSAIARYVEQLPENPRDLLFEGEAGIGKTTIWRAGTEAAIGAGYRVLASRPGEHDKALTYSAIGDLIGDVFEEALADAPDPQRRALEVALLRRPSTERGPDRRVIALGVREAIRTLCAARPVVLAVDDAQWLDPSSARVLAFALRRLSGHPVAVLATIRPDVGADLMELISTLRDRNLVRIEVGPLDVEHVGSMLRERFGRTMTPPLVRRLHESARGNPFFSLEIARAMHHAEPSAGRPLPIPDDAREVLRTRIEGLSTSARDVALVVSAMARPTVGAIRSAAVDPSHADAAIAEAEEAGLMRVDGADVSFVHPLVGSAVYWLAPRRTRESAHARLAQVAVDIEERARHVALSGTGPDPDAASLVEGAADVARGRGAPHAAADLLELSAELTPPGDVEGLCGRRRLAALNRFDAGDVEGARSRLQALIDTTPSRAQRALTMVELAVRAYNDVDRVHDLLHSALPDVGETFHTLVFANLAWVAIFRFDPAAAVEHARDAVDVAGGASEQTSLRVALGALGHAVALLGRDAEPTMRRATAITEDVSPGEAAHPASIRGQQLLWHGRVDEARRLVKEADSAYTEAGLELMRYDSLPILSEIEATAGDWHDAAIHADEGYDIIVDAGLHEIRDQVLYPRARVAALVGRVDDARRDANEGLSLATTHGNRWAEVQHRSVLGFVAMSTGDPAEAERMLAPAERLMSASGIAEPGAFPFIPDLAEALVELGRLDRAKQVVDRLHEQGLALDRALALATSARCRALIAAGLGDQPSALLELERAFAEHERVAIPFESARTRLINGQILRRMKRKREARESLEDARSQFRGLGARLWETRADAALARIGGRSASPTELSETERRIADVVSLGLTNKEAADRLFMSVKTVESNLRRVYRKLGVRSRTELARRHRPSHPDDQT